MKAEQTTLTKILEINSQYKIPIYQRTYDWHKEHCKQLYDDIIKIGNAKDGSHFIGSVTYMEESTMADDVSSYQVIDGQQRLTTIMLLLRALRDYIDADTKNVTEGKINQLLFNVNEDKEKNRYKLILNTGDSSTFKDILDDGGSDSTNTLTSNFRNFKSWMLKDSIDPLVLWRGIQRLTVVQIKINEKDDDAQVIFESMNSTGLDLSETDMIQNYILMSENQKRQKEIYENYWYPMEQSFVENRDNFDEFLRHYLMMRKTKFIAKSKIYVYFKKYMKDKDKNIEIKNIYEYSKHYVHLIGLSKHPSYELNKVIKYIHAQRTNNAYPLLLKILADHENGIIDEDQSKKIFLLVDSYLLRCHVCGLTKAANKLFPEIISQIDTNNYVRSMEYILMSQTGYRKFPRNPMFKEKLQQFPLYTNATMCKYMLVRLEYGTSDTELADIDSIQIEHIMPQKLSDPWKTMLGQTWSDMHEKYVANIGNLTLTGHNPQLGNKSFSDKCKHYAQSNVRLNRDICDYKIWDENAIKRRAESLIGMAIELWTCPTGYEYVDDVSGETYEEDYLEGKETHELWYDLKTKITTACPSMIFNMTHKYGTFRVPVTGKSKSSVVCSIESIKNSIHVTFNTKIRDNLISTSKFIRDVSKVGHYAVGEFRSTIMDEQDIDRVVNLIKIIWEDKIKNM